jgi:hypothetical protein
MAFLKGKTLFFTTSPRTPLKMIPEIKLLAENFTDCVWNEKKQIEFIKMLAEEEDFKGVGSANDLALSARDRINRAPKALGFINLKPTIQLTEPGELFINGKRPEEILLRQILKFQLPSPYHKETVNLSGLFGVKPYLEMFRLVDTLGSLSFDEMIIFGMQLTHYSKFDEVVAKIQTFRRLKTANKGKYKEFRGDYLANEICEIYADEISEGNTKTRESNDKSLAKFIKTKASNMRDYTDACFRYLRATGMVEISQRGHSISIMQEKEKEVEFFLRTIDRRPIYVDDKKEYKRQLFDTSLPVLYSDDKQRLIEQVAEIANINTVELAKKSTETLKDILGDVIENKRAEILKGQVARLKSYAEYNDVIETFDDIKGNNFYDTPLMLEWNTWRAMTMLDGGDIKANLKFDDMGQPMNTAMGNMADICCDYGDFGVTVEVTMQSGHKQYEMEGESIARHLAKFKKDSGKDAYCFFIAPKINESCIAYFFALHKMNISYYGGSTVIVPIELDVFMKMVKSSYDADYIPNPNQIKNIFEFSLEKAQEANSESEWYSAIKNKTLNWLCA